MMFGDMGSYAILNPYNVLYLPLKFVSLITIQLHIYKQGVLLPDRQTSRDIRTHEDKHY